MVSPHKLFGRLGNSMFQYATLIALADTAESDIYFQDIKWFENHQDKVREMFNIGIGSTPKIGIHVRRGDYIQFSHQYPNLMETDYYRKAMAMFKEKDFIVFSDDIEWCKKQDIFKGCEFSEGKTDVQDLNLMASCNGLIMANSTFSFWGAYLGPSNKVVVCPRQELWGTPISLLDKWHKI